MENLSTASPALRSDVRLAEGFGAHHSGVSWGAIFAGAAAAAALSLILAILGFGLGMSAISPWSNSGASAEAIGISSVAWVVLTQLAAAGLGGYLAGRLRIKWTNVHTDEVYFRDTAHGFMAWSVATIATAALLASTIGAIANSGVQAGATALSGVGSAATVAAARWSGDSAGLEDGNGGVGYSIDRLFRASPSAAGTAVSTSDSGNGADGSSVATPGQAAASGNGMTRNGGRGDYGPRGETLRIFAASLQSGSLNPVDAQYVAQQIAARTGISQQEAETRVREAYDQISKAAIATKEAADKARKAAAHTALWLFVSLLAGAFFASFMATFGGKRRDGMA
ncbi:MAG: hypothetical protein ABI411_15535 [Tahibacter sp.]